jgi:hypothetical protein
MYITARLTTPFTVIHDTNCDTFVCFDRRFRKLNATLSDTKCDTLVFSRTICEILHFLPIHFAFNTPTTLNITAGC